MENIVGTWALIKTKAVDANGTPTKTAPFGGTDFIGRVVFTKEGRMSAAITDSRAKIPEEESREYSCYAGAYTLKDSTLITKVDACSDPARMGTEQVRTVSFEDDIMVLQPPLRSYGNKPAELRTLWWKKISDI
tara:strand:- start:1200 stop:1601 length:402 start_codon:yes stop_codon:yes gene_type:complete